MLGGRHNSAGDTIVEVLFAVTVFSLVAVGALSIMNQGTAISQRSLEITLVRQEIDAQAEALRFINNAYVASYRVGATSESTGPVGAWNTIKKGSLVENVTSFGVNDEGVCNATPPPGSFVLNTRTASLVSLNSASSDTFAPDIYAQVRYHDDNTFDTAQGLWIEAARGASGNTTFIDFHIRACWDAPASTVPVTLGTIVRLYEPKE